MNFNLSESQTLLQKEIKAFSRREIEPRAKEMDAQSRLPDDLIGKMARINLLGMIFPPQYNGSSAGLLDCLLAVEQLAYTGTGAWWICAFANSIPESIFQFGTDEQKRTYLTSLYQGEIYPSIQFTEAETGSDPKAFSTTAVLKGDRYIINGAKRFSTFGSRKGFAVLYAKDDAQTCSAFIIDKHTAGYSTSPAYDLMGSGGVEAVDVYLDNVTIDKQRLLGRQGEGLKILQHWIGVEKIQQCGACVGIAQAALDEAIDYASLKTVRKKTLSGLMTIQAMAADMYARLEAARCFAYRSAFLKDDNHPDWMTNAAAAKIFVVPAAMDVVDLSRRIHGACGYTKDYKIERLYRAVAGASAIAVSLELNKSIVASAVLK